MNYAAARKHMVDSQVRPNNVTNLTLQQAMEEVPRESFVPMGAQAMAYAEIDVEIFSDRYMLRARDFSKLVHAARITEDELVLDVGCGYGYSSAILARLASMVMAVEEEDEIVAAAEQKLGDMSLDNVVVVRGSLIAGLPQQGPFDAIVIAGGAVDKVPKGLLDQLKDGGRLVCVVMRDGLGHAMVYTKSGDHIGERAVFEASPKGLLPGFAAEKAFVF